jgi:nicotinamidase/pyrazinamidase
MRDALILIDVQNDFCPGGALAVPHGDEVVTACNALAALFSTVVLTQDWHPAGHASFASSHPGHAEYDTVEVPWGSQVLWPDHCVQGSPGAEFHRALHVNRASMVIRKGTNPAVDSYSAFFENDRSTPTGLLGSLRELGVGRVVLAGLATDYCVRYSALDARRAGLSVVLVDEACRGIDRDGSVAAAWAELTAAGCTRAARVSDLRALLG